MSQVSYFRRVVSAAAILAALLLLAGCGGGHAADSAKAAPAATAAAVASPINAYLIAHPETVTIPSGRQCQSGVIPLPYAQALSLDRAALAAFKPAPTKEGPICGVVVFKDATLKAAASAARKTGVPVGHYIYGASRTMTNGMLSATVYDYTFEDTAVGAKLRSGNYTVQCGTGRTTYEKCYPKKGTDRPAPAEYSGS